MKAVYSLAWEIDPFEDILDTFEGVTFTKANAKEGFGPEIEEARSANH